jgi:6-phosphogluconate dehydrogenase
MVHNAIEYGMMQSIAEGYHLIHGSPFGINGINIRSAANVWQSHSVIDSWLNELARDIVNENPNLDGIDGSVAENGEARWALEVGASQNIDMPAIQASLDVRKKSQTGQTSYTTKMLAALRNKFGGHNINGEGRA